MANSFEMTSYEKKINKKAFVWQNSDVGDKLVAVCSEQPSYSEYADIIKSCVGDYVSVVSDYLAYRFNRTGENLYFVMPVLANELLNKDDEQFDISDWRLPFEVCFFKIPDNLFVVDEKQVEGIYVEEERVKKQLVGIRCVAVDYDGEALVVYEVNFNMAKPVHYVWRIDNVLNEMGDENSQQVMNEMLRFVNNVLEYIHSILGKDEEVDEDLEDEAKETNSESNSKRNKKQGDKKEQKKIGVKVVVLCETTKKKKAGKRTGQRLGSNTSVCHPVEGYWKTYKSDILYLFFFHSTALYYTRK